MTNTIKQMTINTLKGEGCYGKRAVEFLKHDGYIFHTDLQCFIDKIEYDPRIRTGSVFIALGGCCDMSGCLRFFQTIDDKVKIIRTFSGTGDRLKWTGPSPYYVPDTIYARDDRGELSRWFAGRWIAGMPREHARLIAAAEQEEP
jgi:hypothetical protein